MLIGGGEKKAICHSQHISYPFFHPSGYYVLNSITPFPITRKSTSNKIIDCPSHDRLTCSALLYKRIGRNDNLTSLLNSDKRYGLCKIIGLMTWHSKNAQCILIFHRLFSHLYVEKLWNCTRNLYICNPRILVFTSQL